MRAVIIVLILALAACADDPVQNQGAAPMDAMWGETRSWPGGETITVSAPAETDGWLSLEVALTNGTAAEISAKSFRHEVTSGDRKIDSFVSEQSAWTSAPPVIAPGTSERFHVVVQPGSAGDRMRIRWEHPATHTAIYFEGPVE